MSDIELLAQVRPPDWKNPDPLPMYDLVVIGGGTAGLVCAAGAAGLGARVALVERASLGGDCLNTGCVPSKTFIHEARQSRASCGTWDSSQTSAVFPALMRSVRLRRAELAPHDSAARLTSLGVHVFFGAASFGGPRLVVVDGRALRFGRAVIATGARAAVPPIPGLSRIPFLTSEGLFDLDAQPRTLLVLGAGPLGCEMAQAFSVIGTQVTLIEAAARILPHEDPDAAAIVSRQLAADAVRVTTGVRVREVAMTGGQVVVTADGETFLGDRILVATGRTASIEGLGLEQASVTSSPDGIVVDDHLRTSNRRVYAAGDVCAAFKFTHAADAMARVVIQNALFHGRRRASALVIPWCTYTSPELAHVGIPAVEAARRGAAAVTIAFSDVDRAVIDRSSDGFLRIHHRGGRIVAATIVGAHAGELIGYCASAMRRGARLGDFSQEIFPYPTRADGFRRAGDAYRRSRLTPVVRATLERYFGLLRKL